jgi:hypothetical protein
MPPNKKSTKLNPKHRLFVAEYLKDQNATQAYIRVYGGKTTSAGVNGHQLLKNTKIQMMIERGLARLADRALITPERNLKRIAEIAYHDKTSKKSDILKACELIGKTFGQFKDVVESKNVHTIAATPEQVDEATDKFKDKL